MGKLDFKPIFFLSFYIWVLVKLPEAEGEAHMEKNLGRHNLYSSLRSENGYVPIKPYL